MICHYRYCDEHAPYLHLECGRLRPICRDHFWAAVRLRSEGHEMGPEQRRTYALRAEAALTARRALNPDPQIGYPVTWDEHWVAPVAWRRSSPCV